MKGWIVVNLMFVLSNLLAGGVMVLAVWILGDSDNLLAWLTALAAAIGSVLLFWFYALKLLKRKPP